MKNNSLIKIRLLSARSVSALVLILLLGILLLLSIITIKAFAAFAFALAVLGVVEVNEFRLYPWLEPFLMLLCGAGAYCASPRVLDISLLRPGVGNIILGILICTFIIAFFSMLTGKTYLGVVIGAFVPIALATVNAYVYSFRGTELFPDDFKALVTAMNVASGYTITIDKSKVYGFAAYAVLILGITAFVQARQKLSLRKRLVMLAVLICGGYPLGTQVYKVTPHTWMVEGSYLNGFILNFTRECMNLKTKPNNYSLDTIRSCEQAVDTSESGTGSPIVIVIMNESFSDLGYIEGHGNSDGRYVPNFTSLRENAIWGYALSSIYGGNTGNSEYELLTGNSMFSLPVGSIAYQQYVQRESNSILRRFKPLGYYCFATHPYYSSGWMRTRAYPYLGFDNCTFVDDYPQEDTVRDFVSDLEMYRYILNHIEASKKEHDRQFIFGVTMQNHGGYNTGLVDLIPGKEYPSAAGNFPDAIEYCSLIQRSDDALGYFVEQLKNMSEPVVLLFFGDHLPSLDPAFYDELLGKEFETLDEKQLMYSVPFAIWANYDIEEQNVGLTSLNYLGNFLFEAAGLSLPPYNQLLEEIRGQIPALNVHGYYSPENQCMTALTDAQGEEAFCLDLYRQLQYNNIFDSSNHSEILFPTR